MQNQLATYRMIAALVGAVALLAGCAGSPPLHQPKPLTALPDSGYRMNVVWQTDTGDGAGNQISGLAPTVADGEVFAAGTGGNVTALAVDSGEQRWQIDTGEHLIAGPTVSGDRLFVTSVDGQLLALATDGGKSVWQRQLSGEVIAAPAASGATVVVRTLDGRLVAFDTESGARRWTVQRSQPRLTMRGTSAPVIVGQTVYAGMDSGKVLAVALKTGKVRWSQVLALPTGRSELDRIVDIDANLLISRNQLYAISAGERLAALSRGDGSVVWRQPLASTVGMAGDARRLYIVTSASDIVAVSRRDGSVAWRQAAFEYRGLSMPSMYRGDVLVGDYQGYLHWLSADDGSEIARGHPFGRRIQAAPLVVGERAIVMSDAGELAAVEFLSRGG